MTFLLLCIFWYLNSKYAFWWCLCFRDTIFCNFFKIAPLPKPKETIHAKILFRSSISAQDGPFQWGKITFWEKKNFAFENFSKFGYYSFGIKQNFVWYPSLLCTATANRLLKFNFFTARVKVKVKATYPPKDRSVGWPVCAGYSEVPKRAHS